MAGYEKRKVVRQEHTPQGRHIPDTGNPDKYYDLHPVWKFSNSDKLKWPLDQENAGDLIWSEIIPRLKEWEKNTWSYILVNCKKENHSIVVEDLSKSARDRLAQIPLEQEALISLRLNGTHRLYGYIVNGVYNILWFDKNHGDNDTCVCRSNKKHT